MEMVELGYQFKELGDNTNHFFTRAHENAKKQVERLGLAGGGMVAQVSIAQNLAITAFFLGVRWMSDGRRKDVGRTSDGRPSN